MLEGVYVRNKIVNSSLLMKSILIGGFGLFAGLSNSYAADLVWSGNFRVEAVGIQNPELSSAESNKTYLLDHLVLTPKIEIADGVSLYSRLDVLNNSTFGISNDGVVHSVAGEVIGRGPGTGISSSGGTSSTDTDDSNALAHTQRSAGIAVTSLYLSWAQEFGQLVVGRMPVQYGLGINYNAGAGLFDHYIDTKDVIGYRVIFGNLSLFPILAKVNEGSLGAEDDVNDYILHVAYENPETELLMGLFYQVRVATFAGNDTPLGGEIGGSGAVRTDGFRQTLVGLYSSQKVDDFKVGVEANLLSGGTGLNSAAGLGVDVNSYGIGAEVAWEPKTGPLSGILKLGIASGDDPDTKESYEGFIFNRNYNVALLMFNHPLGQKDFFRTGLVRKQSGTQTDPAVQAAIPAVQNQIDTEALSNAIYLAPTINYRSSEKITYSGTFIYGMLNKDPIPNSSSTAESLGFEIDISVSYRPFERFTWTTEAGLLFPGEAWKGGDLKLDNKNAFGVISKAAISF